MFKFQNLELYVNTFRIELYKVLENKRSQNWFKQFHFYFKEKKGLEIGGPSSLFTSDILPVYELSETIDGCNFSSTTVWEGTISSDEYCYFKNKKGKQFIAEGSELKQIENEQYDFLLSSHNLEHLANPIKALKEWQRVLRRGGIMFLVLPDKRFTFDKKRPFTTFEHLMNDYKEDISENDLTHLPEVLKLHHFKLDPINRKDFEKFKQRSEMNFENRCLHHHVFSQHVLKSMLLYLGIEVVSQKFVPSIHQIIIGKKV